MQKLLCYIGIHNYKTVNMTNAFYTKYVNWPDSHSTNHIVWYQQCSCGKRKLKDTVKEDSFNSIRKRHNGVEYARVGWEAHGKMYHVNEPFAKPTPPVKLVKGD